MKKKMVLFITSLLMMVTVQARDIDFSFSCVGPNLHYISQFQLDGSIRITEQELELLDQSGLPLVDLSFEAQIKNAGFDAVENTLIMKNLKGTLKKFEAGSLTNDAFYNLELVSDKDSESFIYAGLNINYPGFLTSKIRVNNLREYKGVCKLVQR